MEFDRSTVRWVKSSASNGSATCVETASVEEGEILVRNSNDPEGPILAFTKAEWVAFIIGAKAGEFDAIV
jgi:hypothetical protein